MKIEITDEMREALEGAVEQVGFSLELVRLVDGESTYKVSIGGATREFSNTDDAYIWIGDEKRRIQAERVFEAVAPLIADKALEKAEEHPDDQAVNRFAEAMKAKLKWEREERSRSGWEDPVECGDHYLAEELVAHLEKGNGGTFEDVANFAMMLHQRGADPLVLKKALRKHV